MKKLIQDNSNARQLQMKLLNTCVSNSIYNSLCERFTHALEALPPEGKMMAQNGFLIPWRAE